MPEPKVIIEDWLLRKVLVQILRNQRIILGKLTGADNHIDTGFNDAYNNTKELISELED